MQDDDMVEDEEMVDYDEEIKKVKQKLEKNPHNEKLLDTFFELLEKNGDFEELEDMRTKISAQMPLSLNSYIHWIEQKEKEENTDETKRVLKLALSDYQSTNLWFHWISAHDKDDVNTRRKVYEEALSAVGYYLDIADGLWECYLVFEKSIGSDKDRLNSLYAQALSIPYVSLGDLWVDYKQYCEQNSMQLDPHVEQTFMKTQEALKVIRPHEMAFKEDPCGYGITYLDFITAGSGNPSHVQAIYERILENSPKDDSWWSHYCNWCENKLKVPSVALSVYKRAVRHCSSNPYLWQGLLTSAERAHEDPALINTYWESAKETISDAQSGVFLYRTYIYMLRRRAAATDKDYRSVGKLFEEGHRALEEYFGHEWDQDGVYRRNYAYFLASTMGNMNEARKLWQDILATGGGKLVEKWLDAVRLERQFGDVQNARKLLYKAINSVSDNPPAIYDYFIQFEREEGTLEELDTALEKVNAQERHRSSRPQKQKKEKEVREKPTMKKRAGGESGGPPAKIAIPKTKEVAQVKKDIHPPTPPLIKDKDGFTMPFPCAAPRKSKTPEPAPKKSVPEKAAEPETSKNPMEKEQDGKWTVFCSNIDFKATAEDIKSVLEGVRDVRLLVRPGQKHHKGVGFIDFDNEQHYRQALDRKVTFGKRTVFIAEEETRNRPDFKSKNIDRKLTAAKSNRPARAGPSGPSSNPTSQSAGSETARRSILQIVPRAVATKAASSNGSTGKSLSNDEFRKKFVS